MGNKKYRISNLINRIQIKFINLSYIHNLLNGLGYYQLDEVQNWGHCGLCGNPILHKNFPKVWAWGLCEDCKKEYEERHKNDLKEEE